MKTFTGLLARTGYVLIVIPLLIGGLMECFVRVIVAAILWIITGKYSDPLDDVFLWNLNNRLFYKL